MQTIYSFSYTPAIATGTNSTNTVYRMAYQQPIMLYKGTANTIKIVVFNSKQKVVDLTEYDVQIQIVDRETQEHFITKTGTIDTPTSGVATITFTESDLRDLDNRFYHIIARLTDPADESSIVGNEILYLDDNYGAFTPVTIENAWNFNPSNLPVSGTADLNLGNIIPLLNNTYYLGNVDYRWHSLYTGNVKVGNITINGSSISTAPSSANNLILTANRHSLTFSDVSVGTQGIGATLRFDDIENSPGPRFETWYGNVATPTDPPGQHSLDIYTADVNSYVEFGSYDENTFMGIDSLGAFVYTNWNSDKGQRWNFDSEGFFSLPNNGVIVNNTTNVAVLFNENNLTIRTQDPDGSTQHLSSFNETGGMTIDGDTIPLGNNLHDLGAPANQWKQVHVSDALVLNGAFLRINENNQPTINGAPIISLINSLTHNDDITITTNNIDSSSYVWTFDLNGDLTLPAGGTILNSSGQPYVNGITSISSSVATGLYSDASGDYTYGTLSYDYAVNGVTSGGFSIEYSRPLVGGNVDIHVGNTIVNGDLTLSGDIKSDSNINIDINLSDSTLLRWQFGEDGILTLPSVGKISNGVYDWTFGTDGTTALPGALTVAGNLTIQGTTTNIGTQDLVVEDSIINLHTTANLAALTSDDGRDVGIKMHYYKSSDKHAFIGWDNGTSALEYYVDATETNGVISGTYGNIKAASFISNIATGTAPFTVVSTTQVANLNVATAGSSTTAGTVTTAAQPNITSVGTLSALGVSGAVTASTLVSNIAIGTAPFTVTSTTQVANLNVATAGSLVNGNSNVTIVANANVNISSAGTANVLEVSSTGIAVTGNISGNVATGATSTTAIGYLGIPQSATATTATLAIGDAGKHIYVTTASQTITIPANGSVAYPIGTTIGFIAGPSATTVTIAIATDTMYLGGTGTTGSRTLAAYGMATAVKVAATTWFISGNGLT